MKTKLALLCFIAGLLPLAVITGLSFLDGFSLFSDYVSELGAGQYGLVFNASLVIAALLAAPFLALRRGLISYMFTGALAALVGVGVFPSASGMHWYFAAAFFLLMFASITAAGVKTKGLGRASVVVGLAGFGGLLMFSPFVETILIYMIGAWVMAASIFWSRRHA